jgi:hypothetical protein
MTIKQKIIDELQNPEMLDLKFLFSENVLDLSLEILDELLESEKEDFEKKLALKNEEITFESFLDNSSLDLFFSLLSHLQNVQSSEKIRNIIEQFEPKYIDF